MWPTTFYCNTALANWYATHYPTNYSESLNLSREAADEAIINLLNSADDLKSLARVLEG